MSNTPETTPETPDTAELVDEPSSSSRRMALRALLAGGGAAAGVVAFGKSASAADTDPIIIGEENDGQTPTVLEFTEELDETGPSVFSAGGYVPPAASPFPAGVGGYGGGGVPTGVHGSTIEADGFGVVAANLAELEDEGDVAPAALVLASAAGPHVLFWPLDGAVVGPTPGVHEAGELYRDAEGTLWFTVPAPTPEDEEGIRFVKLAGTPAAGSFHAINPQRAYDSRNDGFSPDGGEMLAPNTNRVISVADGHDGGGNVILENAVPAGATAVQINLTAANPTAENFLAVTDGDTTTTETSVLNWAPDELQIANSITIPVNADREIRVYCGDQNGSTHFIVDVFGYYL